jgi:hypothetical protein
LTTESLADINKRPGPESKRSLALRWVGENKGNVVCYTAFSIVYVALSSVSTPRVYDNFPDSHTYLPVSFLGHAVRLWTIPVLYFFGWTPGGRVALQIVIGLACWITLAVQVGRVLQVRIVRVVAQSVILLISLCAPVLQWNRIILSESLSISLAVLLLATSLALARRMDIRALLVFLVVAVLWTFTRQVQALFVGVLAIPFVLLAWKRPEVRRVAVVGGLGMVVIGVWGTVTALQTSSVSPGKIAATSPSEIQLAGIIQFRAISDRGEMAYLHNHGLPYTSALKSPPPFTTVGQPVNVTQFADPFAEYQLGDDPAFKRWADKHGQSVYLKYLITHPWQAVFQPVIHSPQLMTMNPDYIATPALPSWASTLVYGNLSSVAVPNMPSGAPRSSDPIYAVVLISIAAVLVVLAAVRRRFTRVIWVAVSAIVFIVIWAIAIWDFAATELPREFIEPAVLFHVTAVVLIAAALDSLVSVRFGSSATPNTPAAPSE